MSTKERVIRLQEEIKKDLAEIEGIVNKIPLNEDIYGTDLVFATKLRTLKDMYKDFRIKVRESKRK